MPISEITTYLHSKRSTQRSIPLTFTLLSWKSQTLIKIFETFKATFSPFERERRLICLTLDVFIFFYTNLDFFSSNYRKKQWFWRFRTLWRRFWTIHFGQCPTGFHEPKCRSFSLWEQRRTHQQMWSLCQWICWKLENL